jgi:DNA-binding MarR family transcriptional regulator
MVVMVEPRWLSDSEQQVWRAFLAATRRLGEHVEHQLQHDSGMPVTYYTILVELSEAPERTIRMSELAAACHSSRSRLSHAIAKLEGWGWVSRSGCPTDKRGSYAHLTEDGLAALAAAAPGHVEAVREALFDVLTSSQVRALGEICEAVSDGLAGECAEAAAADRSGVSLSGM